MAALLMPLRPFRPRGLAQAVGIGQGAVRKPPRSSSWAPSTGAQKACATSCSPTDPVGMGYCTNELKGVNFSHVFTAMLMKINQPDHFMPVSKVVIRIDEVTGAVWRSMRYNGEGPQKGTTLREHIYADRSSGAIRFVPLDNAGKEEPYEVVNALSSPPLRLEYFLRDLETQERIFWQAARADVVAEVEATMTIAREAATAERAAACDLPDAANTGSPWR